MADFVLVAFLVVFGYFGAKKGFVKSLLGILSTLISAIISFLLYRPVAAILYYSPIGDGVKNFIRGIVQNNTGDITSGVLIEKSVETGTSMLIGVMAFVIVIVVSKIVVSAAIRIVNLAAKFPLLRQANSLFGFLTGVFSGILISYIVIGIIGALNTGGSIPVIQNALTNSYLAVGFYENNVLTNLISGIAN